MSVPVPNLPQEPKKGEPIRAKDAAATRRAVKMASGVGLKRGYADHDGFASPAAVASEGTALNFAKISGHTGTVVPFRYSGTQVEQDGSSDPSMFSTVSGGDELGFNCINTLELSIAALGQLPIPDDSIVVYLSAGDFFYIIGIAYRGY